MKSTIKSIRVLLPATALFFITACDSDKGQKTSYPAYESSQGTTTYDSTTDNTNMPAAEPAQEMAATAPADNTARTTAIKRKTKTSVGTMPERSSTAKIEADNTGVYEFSEVRASYVGGQTALENYIVNEVEYPQDAMENNTQGTVNVQFTVDENGRISNAHVIGDKLGNGLDEEAVRVVNALPKWQAGTVRGKAVKSKVTLPITFRIEE
jgi:periplasmic protein TonB